jgi:hypothetical protein
VKVWKLHEENIQGEEHGPRSASSSTGSPSLGRLGDLCVRRGCLAALHACGRRIWSTGGFFNRMVTLNEDESLSGPCVRRWWTRN